MIYIVVIKWKYKLVDNVINIHLEVRFYIPVEIVF